MKYCFGDACHNTFILFDCLDRAILDEMFLKEAHGYLLREKKDDALILFDGKFQAKTFCARMLVLGFDGMLAEFCGNGARVCATYLFAHYPLVEKFFLIVKDYICPLIKHEQDRCSIKLPSATFKLNPAFIANDSIFKELAGLVYVDMLEPHLILQENLSDEALISLGRKLNQRKELFPKGINVNAWQVLEDGSLFVKTYERGVQRLTQSCGTGSMSCAAFYRPRGTVLVSTPGGRLEITVQEDGIELKGPACFFN